ncbi:MAG: bacterioferritin [Bdellovibrionales bacterium]|nr:bacterioferritin [Bdellovibrionales bacterium]
MKGDADVIKHLNIILEAELTAINQYFLHARMCQDWGYTKLGNKIYHESIDEMKHAQSLIDRILFLEGLPNLQKLGALRIGETVPEIIKCDLELEYDAIPKLREAIKVCVDKVDQTSRNLFESILASEEEHVDWLEAQQTILNDIGTENYLAQQIEPN